MKFLKRLNKLYASDFASYKWYFSFLKIIKDYDLETDFSLLYTMTVAYDYYQILN